MTILLCVFIRSSYFYLNVCEYSDVQLMIWGPVHKYSIANVSDSFFFMKVNGFVKERIYFA